MSATLKVLLGFWNITVLIFGLGVSLAILMFIFAGKILGGIALLLALIVSNRYLFYIKQVMLKSIPQQAEYDDKSITDAAGIDTTDFQVLCKTLTDQGFTEIQSGQLSSDSGGSSSSFVYHFSHPDYHCFASIFQTLGESEGEMTPVICSLISLFPEGYVLATTTLKPNGLTTLWASPKHFWSYHPKASLDTLLNTHISYRQALSHQLDQVPFDNISWDFYHQWEAQLTHDRPKRLRRRSFLLAMLQATWFEWRQPVAYLGPIRHVTSPL